jgi:hypothetical protein
VTLSTLRVPPALGERPPQAMTSPEADASGDLDKLDDVEDRLRRGECQEYTRTVALARAPSIPNLDRATQTGSSGAAVEMT